MVETQKKRQQAVIIVVLVLAVLILVMSAIPLFKIKISDDMTMAKHYAQECGKDEFNISIGTWYHFIVNYEYVREVANNQRDMPVMFTLFDFLVKDLLQIDVEMDYDEESLGRLAELSEKGSFQDAVCMSLLLDDMYEIICERTGFEIIDMIIYFATVPELMVSPILLFIVCLAVVINKLNLGIKSFDKPVGILTNTHKLYEVVSVTYFIAILLLNTAFFGNHLRPSVGMIGLILINIILSAVCGICRMLWSEVKLPFRLKKLILNAISSVLSLVMLFSFASLNIPLQSDRNYKTLIRLFLVYVLSIQILVAYDRLVDRLRDRRQRAKKAIIETDTPHYVENIILIVAMLVTFAVVFIQGGELIEHSQTVTSAVLCVVSAIGLLIISFIYGKAIPSKYPLDVEVPSLAVESEKQELPPTEEKFAPELEETNKI